MLASQAPARIPLPFAASGSKNAIPTGSQIGITAGRASLQDGFPPLTFTPLAAGGVPPAGADFNGILNMITAMQQWQSAGGSFKYDSAFSTAVGGYPKGAVLSKIGNDGFWTSTVDANTTNPDAGGMGWSDLGATFGGRPGYVYSANDWAYIDKPGGLIVQWGTGSFAGASDTSMTASFPITFPTICLTVIGTIGTILSDTNLGFYQASPSLLRVGYHSTSGAASTGTGYTWLAIGF